MIVIKTDINLGESLIRLVFNPIDVHELVNIDLDLNFGMNKLCGRT